MIPHNSVDTFKQSRLKWILLICLTLVIGIAAHQLWLAWPSMVLKSIEWQRVVNNQLADLLYDAKENPLVSGSYLAGFSFLYGILHALGPGHGKVIVTTYLATQPTKVKTSLVLTFISALCQALVAIALVSILVWGISSSTQDINSQATWFIKLSSILISVLGGMICWRVLKRIYATTFSHSNKPCHNHHEEHEHSCGCGHQHVASPEDVDNASSLREYAGVIMSIGLRPCSGAIMVLFFANVVGLYWMGVVSALLMSTGTAITTSALALLTLSGKRIVHRYLASESPDKQKNWQRAGYGLQLTGGILLVLLGLLLANSPSIGVSPSLMM